MSRFLKYQLILEILVILMLLCFPISDSLSFLWKWKVFNADWFQQSYYPNYSLYNRRKDPYHLKCLQNCLLESLVYTQRFPNRNPQIKLVLKDCWLNLDTVEVCFIQDTKKETCDRKQRIWVCDGNEHIGQMPKLWILTK